MYAGSGIEAGGDCGTEKELTADVSFAIIISCNEFSLCLHPGSDDLKEVNRWQMNVTICAGDCSTVVQLRGSVLLLDLGAEGGSPEKGPCLLIIQWTQEIRPSNGG